MNYENKKIKIGLKFKVLLAFIIGLLILLSFIYFKKVSIRQKQWKTYTNSEFGFSINYPPNMYIRSYPYTLDEGVILKTIHPTQKKVRSKNGYVIYEPTVSAYLTRYLSKYDSLEQIINQNNMTYNGVPFIYKKTTVASTPFS